MKIQMHTHITNSIKRTSIIILALVMTATLMVTGCGKKDETTEIMGRVTAIEGSTITLAIFEQKDLPTLESGGQLGGGEISPDIPSGGQGGDIPGGMGGDIPEDIGGQGVTTPPDVPTGDEDGSVIGDITMDTPTDIPGGGEFIGGGQGEEIPGGDFNPMESGETKIITITDDTALYKMENNTENEATLSDITIGCMVTVSCDNDGHVTKMVIQVGGGEIINPMDQNPGETEGDIPGGNKGDNFDDGDKKQPPEKQNEQTK